jgi:signal transduction histidine kinase/DNA-binding NarL/FixJ family response regulator
VEIGSERISLPKTGNATWNNFTFSDDVLIVCGHMNDMAVLARIERNAAAQWAFHILDHPALRTLSDIADVAVSNGHVAIAGTGGCFDIALSAFDQSPTPPTPHITFPRAASSERGKASLRNLAFDSSSLRLDASEDELRFVMKGGPEYWKQRVKFFYRITPDSAEWTELDPADEQVIQRIGTGEHTLEIESRSLTGKSLAQFPIIRPPHWYASKGADAAYAFVLMGGAFFLVVWRTRRLERRAQLLEERVAQRTAELKKANEAKDEFLASMSHEIRNPLNGVIGISSMLRESAHDERERRLTESLTACADQLRLVLDDVLDFSVIERGDIQLQAARFDAFATVRAAALAVDANLARTRLTFLPSSAEAPWLRGDAGKLRQIISNLISNAHKYGVPPEAEVEVAFHDGHLTIAVSNTGPDIPPADQARIFGSFERGRSMQHKYVRGAGLGLTICSRFARAMGGDVTVKSENGLTRFMFSAPFPVTEIGTPDSVATARTKNGHVLAIEDEPYNRLVLGHVLTGLGYTVDWALNGTEALDIVRSNTRYDLIFTDWMLPDMEGSELVRRIKECTAGQTPPIIAVTAYATAEKRTEAFDAGVSDFVTKPITTDKIQSALQTTVKAGSSSSGVNSVAAAEPLRFGILLDGENPRQRIIEFRTELLRRLGEIEKALQAQDSSRTASSAHALASQLLAIHHHTFADQLRALETAATRGEWDCARKLCATCVQATSTVCRQLDQLLTAYPAV